MVWKSIHTKSVTRIGDVIKSPKWNIGSKLYAVKVSPRTVKAGIQSRYRKNTERRMRSIHFCHSLDRRWEIKKPTNYTNFFAKHDKIHHICVTYTASCLTTYWLASQEDPTETEPSERQMFIELPKSRTLMSSPAISRRERICSAKIKRDAFRK